MCASLLCKDRVSGTFRPSYDHTYRMALLFSLCCSSYILFNPSYCFKCHLSPVALQRRSAWLLVQDPRVWSSALKPKWPPTKAHGFIFHTKALEIRKLTKVCVIFMYSYRNNLIFIYFFETQYHGCEHAPRLHAGCERSASWLSSCESSCHVTSKLTTALPNSQRASEHSTERRGCVWEHLVCGNLPREHLFMRQSGC